MIPTDIEDLEPEKRYYIENLQDNEEYFYGTFLRMIDNEPVFYIVVSPYGISYGADEMIYSPDEYSYYEMEDDDVF